MVSKQDKDNIQRLLQETITLLCKNGLPYDFEINVEALIGVTLDSKDVVLVSIKDQHRGNNILAKPPGPCEEQSHDKKRKSPNKSTITKPKPKRRRGRPPKRARQKLDTDTDSDDDDADFDVAKEEPTMQESDAQVSDAETIDLSHSEISEALGTKTHIKYEHDESDDVTKNNQNTTLKGSRKTSASMNWDSEEDGDSDKASNGGSGDSDSESCNNSSTGNAASQILEQIKAEVMKHTKTVALESHSNLGGLPVAPSLMPMSVDDTQRFWQKASFRKQKTTKEKSPKQSKRKGKAEKKTEEPSTPMCHICGRKMSTEKNLKKHVRRHLGTFSVYCDECGKGFFDRTDLLAHMAKHENRKLYQCHICGRSYSYKRGLLKHIKKDHEGATLEKIDPNYEKTEASNDGNVSLPENVPEGNTSSASLDSYPATTAPSVSLGPQSHSVGNPPGVPRMDGPSMGIPQSSGGHIHNLSLGIPHHERPAHPHMSAVNVASFTSPLRPWTEGQPYNDPSYYSIQSVFPHNPNH